METTTVTEAKAPPTKGKGSYTIFCFDQLHKARYLAKVFELEVTGVHSFSNPIFLDFRLKIVL